MAKKSRSAAKTASWRILASTDTFILSWVIITFMPDVGVAGIAGAIAGFEIITKLLLYYLHERAWSKINWGRT